MRNVVLDTLVHLPVTRQLFAWSFDVLVAWLQPIDRIRSQQTTMKNPIQPMYLHSEEATARAHL
jgi:hypothetical protein